jgi:hypothetical protein
MFGQVFDPTLEEIRRLVSEEVEPILELSVVERNSAPRRLLERERNRW